MNHKPVEVQRAIRKTLLEAARFIERSGPTHPYRAIWMIEPAGWKRCAAWDRLRLIAGRRVLLSREAEIDLFVAAAMWED